MERTALFIVSLLIWFPSGRLCSQSLSDGSPLEIACRVADNIVDNTRFGFEYVVQPVYPDAEVIDFGNSFPTCKAAVGFALSTLFSEIEQSETIQVGHTDGIKIWINDELVYERKGDWELPVEFGEKTYILPYSFNVRLKKGANKILVKSECRSNADNWLVVLQSNNLGRYAEKGQKITCSLKELAPNVELSNWLILGPFDNPIIDNIRSGIDMVFEPESSIVFYRMYNTGSKQITWNIPRVNIIAENPGGGKFYSWVYHVGGSIWGFQRLSQVTGDLKYSDYAARWCDYSLSTIPLAHYQTKGLHAYRSSNWSLIHRPMLDYTTAPAIPFLTRMVFEKEFDNQESYRDFVESITDYVLNRQFRMPNGVFAREYTVDPTVWADDMFMGLPWLLFAADYSEKQDQKAKLYNDVANQVLQFSNYLFDPHFKLFRQACYPSKPELKVPFWSRGNGWAVWAITETLLHLPKTHPSYEKILDLYRLHIEGIVNTQDEDGFWRNVLNLPETVRESSGAAIFTLAIARGINQGWISREKYLPVVIKAWEALKTFIDDTGDMHGVKAGTNFSTDPEDYAKTPIRTSDTHGVLPLVFAAIEMNQLLKN